MRPTLPESSPLFLLRASKSAPGCEVDYLLTADSARVDTPGRRATSLDWGTPARSRTDQELAAALSEAVVVEEPPFFSDKPFWEALVNSVLPSVIPARRFTQTLRIWSIGCATGQTTYGLAISIAESYPQLANWKIELVGSDTSSAALARARCGIYSRFEVQRGLSLELLGRYFERLPSNGGWRFNAHQVASIRWLPIGSAHSDASVGPVDIAVCHRAPAELALAARRELFGRLANQIASDGFLVLESNEPAWPTAGFEPLCAGEVAVYRRTRRESSVLSA